MNSPRRILDRLTTHRAPEPDVRMKISNLTRQTVLASRVEVADRGPKRSKGLLGREGLAAEEGLWIVPCEAVHTFAMRFPIDLVYIDRQKRVKKVRSAVPPWHLSACLSAHSIIELAAGAASTARTVAGDQLEFSSADACERSGIGYCSGIPNITK